jgi:Holliday junction DNA helicase RuvA
MIAKLTGIIDSIGEDWVVIDVNGVGYLVFCSSKTLAKLPSVGMDAKLYIETHVREDHIHLYGFASSMEKHWFSVLTTVQGVGAKVGLAILSAIDADDITNAIMAGDKTAFTRANGVGPKVATRIITELQDKIGKMSFDGVALDEPKSKASSKASASSAPSAASSGDVAKEALSALVNLGYPKMEAFGVINKVIISLGSDATTQAVISASLKEMGKNIGF